MLLYVYVCVRARGAAAGGVLGGRSGDDMVTTSTRGRGGEGLCVDEGLCDDEGLVSDTVVEAAAARGDKMDSPAVGW